MNWKRIIVAIILLALTIGAFISGGFPLALFVGAFVFVGVRELVNIAKAHGMNPPFHFIVLSCFLLIGLTSFKLYNLLFPAFTIIAILSFLAILFRGKEARINDVSITLLSIIYAGIFPIHIIMTRDLDVRFVIFIIFTIAACDIAAYYIGIRFGKNPLWKEISPKKTIEGSAAGTIGGLALALFMGNVMGLSVIQSLTIGFLIVILAQLGDLSESMLKREVGIKDSGTVLPGHGGVLDRTDSYIFTGVVAYYYFKFFVVG
ncbi:MAG: hypothetical protein A2Y25_01060 [Candidatus Melainabacteria bacterium GWF2_37_15]|nr:MAG: hypothetical protein A2Y25_01060 [Candidatus Melainabacteria bacterium GWF2_37_15]